MDESIGLSPMLHWERQGTIAIDQVKAIKRKLCIVVHNKYFPA